MLHYWNVNLTTLSLSLFTRVVSRQAAKIAKFEDSDLRLGVHASAKLDQLLTQAEQLGAFSAFEGGGAPPPLRYDPAKKHKPTKKDAAGNPLLNVPTTGPAAERAAWRARLAADPLTHETRVSKLTGLVLPAMALSPGAAAVPVCRLVVRRFCRLLLPSPAGGGGRTADAPFAVPVQPAPAVDLASPCRRMPQPLF